MIDEIVKRKFEELKNYAIYHFYENESGIWLATENGVYLLKRGEGITRHFNKETGDLQFDHIKHISESMFMLQYSTSAIRYVIFIIFTE